jgi:hypothetical protein
MSDPERGDQRMRVLRAARDGGAPVLITYLPGILSDWASLDLSRDGTKLVCSIREAQVDAWRIDGIRL